MHSSAQTFQSYSPPPAPRLRVIKLPDFNDKPWDTGLITPPRNVDHAMAGALADVRPTLQEAYSTLVCLEEDLEFNGIVNEDEELVSLLFRCACQY